MTEDGSRSLSNEPFKSDPSASTVTWGIGSAEATMIVHASGAQTGLACSIAEHIWKPGDQGGFHAHMLEDEAFFILEGEVTVHMPEDDRSYTAGPGELIWHPRGRLHNYVVAADQPVRLLQILVPGTGLVPDFFEAIADGAADDIGTDAGAAAFFAWSRQRFGVVFADGPSR